MGHYVIARIAGARSMRVCLMPYGATLAIEGETDHLGAILLAGPLTNLLLVSFSLSVSWILPESYGLLKGFIKINLIIATVNLLPAYLFV